MLWVIRICIMDFPAFYPTSTVVNSAFYGTSQGLVADMIHKLKQEV